MTVIKKAINMNIRKKAMGASYEKHGAGSYRLNVFMCVYRVFKKQTSVVTLNPRAQDLFHFICS